MERFCALILALLMPHALLGQQWLVGQRSFKTGAAAAAYIGGAALTCTSVTTCNVAYTPTVGHLMIVDQVTGLTPQTLVAPRDCTSSSCSSSTDTPTNGLSSALFGTHYAAREDAFCAVSAVTNFQAGISVSDNFITILVREYSGTYSCTAAASAVNSGTGTTATAGSVTPTAGHPAVVSGLFVNDTDTTVFGNSGSYTARLNSAYTVGGKNSGVVGQIVTSTTGAYAAAASTATSITAYGFTVVWE